MFSESVTVPTQGHRHGLGYSVGRPNDFSFAESCCSGLLVFRGAGLRALVILSVKLRFQSIQAVTLFIIILY